MIPTGQDFYGRASKDRGHIVLPLSVCLSAHTSHENLTISSYYETNVVSFLPHMAVLGSSNSAANKYIMSKMLTKGDTIF